MKIIVVGCGKVGYTIVEQLSNEGHDITVVDKNKSRLTGALGGIDVMSYVGDGTSYTTLVNAGIEDTDLLIAVMDSDETNLLCCVIAKKAGHCKTIARVRNPVYSSEIDFLKRELDISMVFNPELASAGEIGRIFKFPYAMKIDVFSSERVELVHFRIKLDSKLSNLRVADIRAKYKCNVLVCMVTRKDEVMIPGGDFILEENDIVGIVATPENINQFFQMFGVGTKKARDVIIVGGGRIGYYLATILQHSGIHVRLIEQSRERCDTLCELLPEADIICGDGTDRKLLLEEGLTRTDGFAALTSIDEENILLSLFAKDKVLSKTVTKINRINFDEVIDQLNLDAIVNPNKISTDIIVQYVRSLQYTMGSNIETFRKLGAGKAEALEFLVKSDSPVVGIPLSKLRIKKDILLCCIGRKGKVIIPGGNDTIEVGDNVIIVHANAGVNDISDIIRQ